MHKKRKAFLKERIAKKYGRTRTSPGHDTYFITAVFKYNLHTVNSTLLKKIKKRKRNMENTLRITNMHKRGVPEECRL